jgi:membrane protein required for colicin V production
MELPFGWVDAVMLGVVALSMIVGVVRGIVFETLSLVGWVAAWIAAQWFGASVAPHLPIGQAGSALNQAAAFALVFVGALIVWAIAARLIRMLIRATPLSALDRLLGAGFGAARAVVLLLVLATVVALTPMVNAVAWKQSAGAAWLHAGLRAISPLLPADLARHLPA